ELLRAAGSCRGHPLDQTRIARFPYFGLPFRTSPGGFGPLAIVCSWKKGRSRVSATIRQLAELVHGCIVGDPDLVITTALPLVEAGAGCITFAEHAKYAAQLHASAAAAAVVPESWQSNGLTIIQVADPLDAFVAIVRHLHGRAELRPQGIDPRSFIDVSAVIGPEPSIQPFAVIGAGTTIGARSRIHSGVSIGRDCRIGDDVTIHPNVV